VAVPDGRLVEFIRLWHGGSLQLSCFVIRKGILVKMHAFSEQTSVHDCNMYQVTIV